ncbi:uncharacterized protein LOC115444240 [Manduca sexta]|uniref:uncharacterized protein LOC115444240 n=1 Tax=Manduca sexta TaxID=7130 RepID=UPI00188EF711|nr:uncharacterized protein LOC115444240 [Manduca sexta]
MTADSVAVDRICRICLKEGNIPIYGKTVDTDFSFDVRTFGDIELTEEDRYPKHLCAPCHALLQSAKLFRKTAKLSDDILKKYDSDEESDEELLSDDLEWDSEDNIKVSELSKTLDEDINLNKDMEDVKVGESFVDKLNLDTTVENLSCAVDPCDIMDSKLFQCESKANTSKQSEKDYKLSTAFLVENFFIEVPQVSEDSNFKCRLKYSKYQCKVCSIQMYPNIHATSVVKTLYRRTHYLTTDLYTVLNSHFDANCVHTKDAVQNT